MVEIALLGATGLVGQKAIELIEKEPTLSLIEISNSTQLHPLETTAPYVLSALPAEVAEEIEPQLLARGQHVFSNASTFRMREDVPLLIPEVNPAHLALVDRQKTEGKLICNPNCMVSLLAPLLAPVSKKMAHVHIVTMQSMSGAGKQFTLRNNIIPNIAGEEEKIAEELQKILGPFSLSVQVSRVPITEGHSCLLEIEFLEKVHSQDLIEAYRMRPELYTLYSDPFSPQPGRDLGPLDTKIHVGRLQQKGNRMTMVAMNHNLVRGAAYGTLLNLQAFIKRNG